jgi:hypothetical protein
MRRFLFVGEQPSKTADERKWTWESGRLSAKTLFDALRACGIDPERCGFVNAFCDHSYGPDGYEIEVRVRLLRATARAGLKLVAMGDRVSKLLDTNGIEHITIRHPAARGALRRSDLYAKHVRQMLAPEMTTHVSWPVV